MSNNPLQDALSFREKLTLARALSERIDAQQLVIEALIPRFECVICLGGGCARCDGVGFHLSWLRAVRVGRNIRRLNRTDRDSGTQIPQLLATDYDGLFTRLERRGWIMREDQTEYRARMMDHRAFGLALRIPLFDPEDVPVRKIESPVVRPLVMQDDHAPRLAATTQRIHSLSDEELDALAVWQPRKVVCDAIDMAGSLVHAYCVPGGARHGLYYWHRRPMTPFECDVARSLGFAQGSRDNQNWFAITRTPEPPERIGREFHPLEAWRTFYKSRQIWWFSEYIPVKMLAERMGVSTATLRSCIQRGSLLRGLVLESTYATHEDRARMGLKQRCMLVRARVPIATDLEG